MNALFLKLLNMSAAGSVLILAVVLLHLLLKKAPRWILCAMWALVAIRLISPVSIASPTSAFRATPSIISEQGEVEVFRSAGGSEKPMISVDTVQIERPSSRAETIREIPGTSLAVTQRSRDAYLPPLLQAYVLGLVAMLSYAFSSTLLIKRRVAASLRQAGNVRVCDTLDSPFILGIFRPVIYLPSFLNEQEREFVLAHERAHLRRRDHWWKPLGFVVLCLHWFNPLCWLAYYLLCRDIELACDERVVRELGHGERAAYSQTLLNCSVHRNLAACPVAFGETGVKMRVKAALSYKRPAFWLVLTAALACVILAGCFATNPTAQKKDALTPATTETPLPPEPTASPAPVVDDDALVYTTERIVYKDRYNKYAEHSLSRSMESCTIGERAYYFDASISKEDRAARIRETEELFLRLGIDPALNICLYTTRKDTYIEDGSVYGRFGSLTGVDYTAAVLLGVYGEFANYGMAKGYARLLAGETPEEIGELSADWAYYDLNVLCFQPKFSGEEDAALCEKLALSFAADYVAKHGDAAYLDLLRQSGQPEEAEAARAALLDFYATQGVKPSLSPILYAMGGFNYDYIAKCEYASFFMEVGWLDKDPVEFGLCSKNYLHENYSEVSFCFETIRSDMRQFQEYFDMYPYRNDLPIVFLRPEAGMKYGGLYEPRDLIYLNTLESVLHEYIHVQTYHRLHDSRPTWQLEGLATYYEPLFSQHQREIFDAIYGEDWMDDPLFAELEQEIAQAPREEAFWRCYVYMCSNSVYYYDTYLIQGHNAYNSHSAYKAAASFIDYLFRQYGEREVLDYMFVNHDLTTLTDMTFLELTAAWKEENETRFAGFPKYEG